MLSPLTWKEKPENLTLLMLILTYHTRLQSGPLQTEDKRPVKPEGRRHLQTAVPAQSKCH